MKIVHLKPAEGVRVLDPGTMPPSPLPPEGKRVGLDIYWRRRLHDGDVELVKTGAAPSKPATKTKAPKE